MADSGGRRARPMVRMIIGTVLTLVGLVFDPTLAIAIGAVSGLWVLLGVGAVIHDAADKPSEHRVRVDGSVAHVVIEPKTAKPAPAVFRPQLAEASRVSMIECPRCSLFVEPGLDSCACGWIVPDAARRPKTVEDVLADLTDSPKKLPTSPRVSPACPQCRAPTAWVGEFERFFCARCDAYL